MSKYKEILAKRLFSYQDDAIENLAFLDTAKNVESYSTMIAIPTGGGKTRVAIDYLYKYVFSKPGNKVLWIAERLVLLGQTDNVFEKRLAELEKNVNFSNGHKRNITRCYLSSDGENYKEIDFSAKDLIIITQQTLSKELDEDKEKKFDGWVKNTETLTVIIDEAHHATSEPYLKILRYIEKLQEQYKNKVHLIGLTATPLDEELGKIFRMGVEEKYTEDGRIKRKVSTNTSYAYETHMETLIATGVLSRPKLIEIPNAKGDSIVEKVVDTYCKGKDTFGQTIIFMPSRAEALELEYALKGIRIKDEEIKCGLAISIDDSLLTSDDLEGKTKKSNYKYVIAQKNRIGQRIEYYKRSNLYNEKHNEYTKEDVISEFKIDKSNQVREDIRAYRDKKLDVLITVKMLQEGIDIPNIQTVFIADKNADEMAVTQMVGRGLRGELQEGTPTANVVVFDEQILKNLSLAMPTLCPMKGVFDEKKKRNKNSDEKNDNILELDYDYESLKFLLYDIPELNQKLEVRKKYKLVIKGATYFPTAYYCFYKRCMFEWNSVCKEIISFVRYNIKSIYDAMLSNCEDDAERKSLLEKNNDFKRRYDDMLNEVPGLKLLQEGDYNKLGIYYVKYLLMLYLEVDKNYTRFKENLERNEFKRISIAEEINACVDLSEDKQKEVLETLWKNRKDKEDLVWETEEEYVSYVMGRLENLVGVETPTATESIAPIEDSSDDYFSVRLHRDGRKREDLVILLKYIIQGQDLTDMNFYDVFGGTGTVTANMAGFIKGTRYFNDIDASVANFIWYCTGMSGYNIEELLQNYKESDKNLSECCAISKRLLAEKIDAYSDFIIDMGDMAKEIANNDIILKGTGGDADDKRLSVKYQEKHSILNRAIEESKKKIKTAPKDKQSEKIIKYYEAKIRHLTREYEILKKDEITSYIKVYIALYYAYTDYLIRKSEDEDWKKQINSGMVSEHADIRKESQDAVFKFIVANGFSSRKVSTSDATGIDVSGIKTFRRNMDTQLSWLIPFQKRLEDAEVSCKSFADILPEKGADNENTIYYLDPPYFATKQYTCGFSDDSHLEMLKWLRETEGKWVLSCKSYITSEKYAEERELSHEYINTKNEDGNYSLEEYFRLFLYPPQPSKKENGRQVVYADMKKDIENLKGKLYVYYNYLDDDVKMQNQKSSDKEKKFLWCSDYEIMISNIPPNEGYLQTNEKYNFRCEEFKTFFNSHDYGYKI